MQYRIFTRIIDLYPLDAKAHPFFPVIITTTSFGVQSNPMVENHLFVCGLCKVLVSSMKPGILCVLNFSN